MSSIDWTKLDFKNPYFFFVPKDFSSEDIYSQGFRLNNLFKIYNTGIETGRDQFFVDFERVELENKIQNVFKNLDNRAILEKYKIRDSSSFRFLSSLQESSYDDSKIKKIAYRPFDIRYNYYDPENSTKAKF